MTSASEQKEILVTGATGYVGGRLVARLLEKGYPVRIMVRDPSRLEGRPWVEQVSVYQGDVFKPETLKPALTGVASAYYMIHSMGSHGDFQDRDVQAARNFGTAAKEAGVERLIYLGGLGSPEANLSVHLRSRQQTGDILRESGIPVTEFRAAVIVGSGSMSFEMIRYLTERIPIMICPRWVQTRIQPIAIRNVLEYLAAALENPASVGEILEIGGEDVLTYGEMMLDYARVRGLRRSMIQVPVLTPNLSSYWVHWMTPVPASIARPLIEGLRNEVIVEDDTAKRLFPEIQPMDYHTAVERALMRLDAGQVETTWADALTSSQGDFKPVILATHDGMILERRQHIIATTAAAAFSAFSSLGGERGWPSFNWAWELRGLIDRLVGGVGMRRGRRDPDTLRVGDALDFWRVEEVDPERLIRLRAEMKVPGLAWLQFEAEGLEDGFTRLVQTAFFAPKGLFGLVYWYALYPIHAVIFSTMIRNIGRDAVARAQRTAP